LPRPPLPPLFPYTTLFRSIPPAPPGAASAPPFSLRFPQIPIDIGCSEAPRPGDPPVTVGPCVASEERDDHVVVVRRRGRERLRRSEEHTSELQSRSDLVCR